MPGLVKARVAYAEAATQLSDLDVDLGAPAKSHYADS